MYLILGAPDEEIVGMVAYLQSAHADKSETVFKDLAELTSASISSLKTHDLERLTIVTHSSPTYFASEDLTDNFADLIVDRLKKLSNSAKGKKIVDHLKTIEIMSCNAGTATKEKPESHAEILAEKTLELRGYGFDFNVKTLTPRLIENAEQYEFTCLEVGGDGRGKFYAYHSDTDYYEHLLLEIIQKEAANISEKIFKCRAEVRCLRLDLKDKCSHN